MAKPYEKPTVETESVFETLALNCTFVSTTVADCDPNNFGQLDVSR